MADRAALVVDCSDAARQRPKRSPAETMTRIFGHFLKEDPSKATWLVSIITLEADPGGFVLRDYIWPRVTKLPRFRSRLVLTRSGGYFEELPAHELEALRDTYFWDQGFENAPADLPVKLASEASAWKFDLNKPLWRVQYVKLENGTAALVTTISHAIGDGVSLSRMLLDLCESTSSDVTAPNVGKRARVRGAFLFARFSSDVGAGSPKPSRCAVYTGCWNLRRAGRHHVVAVAQGQTKPVAAQGGRARVEQKALAADGAH